MVSQVIKRGFVKRTKEQRKKHVSMLTKAEVNYLSNRVRMHMNRWSLSQHVLSNGRLFHVEYIKQMLAEDLRLSVIEFNETVQYGKKQRRVLLRSQFATPALLEINGVEDWLFANLCMVIDIDTGSIVTTYWNRVSDNHSTMDLRRYDETLKVFN